MIFKLVFCPCYTPLSGCALNSENVNADFLCATFSLSIPLYDSMCTRGTPFLALLIYAYLPIKGKKKMKFL